MTSVSIGIVSPVALEPSLRSMLTRTLSIPVILPISILMMRTLVVVMAWISLLSGIGPEITVILDTSSFLGCAQFRITFLSFSFNSLSIFGISVSECGTIIFDRRFILIGKA